MAWFPNAGPGLGYPQNPAITYMPINRVLPLALMLLKESRASDSWSRLRAFLYSCLIYDQYASEWKRQKMPKNSSQRESWLALSHLPCLVNWDNEILNSYYDDRPIGKTKLLLPAQALYPQWKVTRAPDRLQYSPQAEYELQALTLTEFIEVAYMVRCNLLHGWYDIQNDTHAVEILITGLRFTSLWRQMVQNTTW